MKFKNFIIILLCFFVTSCYSMQPEALILYSSEEQGIEVQRHLWEQAFPLDPENEEVISPYEVSTRRKVNLPAASIQQISFLLEMLSENGYKETFDALQHINQELLLKNLCTLGMNVRHPLIHLSAQALIKQYREVNSLDPDHISNILALYKHFEEEFPLIAASLKMYFYLDSTLSERAILNSYLAGSLSVDTFFSQTAEDYLQLAHNNVIKYNFSDLNALYRGERFDREKENRIAADLLGEGYSPFWQELIKNEINEPYAHLTTQEAYQFLLEIIDFERDVLKAQYLIDSFDLDVNTLVSFQGRQVEVHLLFAAALRCDEKMVELLLNCGANPFSFAYADSREIVINGILALCSSSGGSAMSSNGEDFTIAYNPDPVMENICRMVVSVAKERFDASFQQWFRGLPTMLQLRVSNLLSVGASSSETVPSRQFFLQRNTSLSRRAARIQQIRMRRNRKQNKCCTVQ